MTRTHEERRRIVKVARAYVDHIRNPDKHAYAAAYYRYLIGMYAAPERPVSLSVMAAQAVEMRLAEIFKPIGG